MDYYTSISPAFYIFRPQLVRFPVLGRLNPVECRDDRVILGILGANARKDIVADVLNSYAQTNKIVLNHSSGEYSADSPCIPALNHVTFPSTLSLANLHVYMEALLRLTSIGLTFTNTESVLGLPLVFDYIGSILELKLAIDLTDLMNLDTILTGTSPNHSTSKLASGLGDLYSELHSTSS
jgi:hypothetical protein